MTDASRAAAEEIANWLATAVRHNPTIDADTMHGTIAAIIQRRCSFAAGVEAAAKMIETRCAEVLAKQSGNKVDFMQMSIDTNLRMTCVLLPDLAAAIRSLAHPEEQ